MEEEVVPGIRIRLQAVNLESNPWWWPWGAACEYHRVDHCHPSADVGHRGLDGAGRDRLRQMLGARLTQEDEIVLRCGTERDAQRNREIVWERLRYLLKERLLPQGLVGQLSHHVAVYSDG